MKIFSGSPLALRLVVVGALACVGAGRAQAQDVSLAPTFGSATLKAGFRPAVAKTLKAGGPIKTNLAGVNAYVARAPDFKLHYTAGKYRLAFRVAAQADTTLLIKLPNGNWVANDNGAGGRDPSVHLAKPLSGRYDVFVGTAGPRTAEALLYITEPGLSAPTAPKHTLEPIYGSVSLQGLNLSKGPVAGFRPFVKNLVAGGSIRTDLGGVNAYVPNAPSFRVYYRIGDYPLMFHVASSADTTLLIRLPDQTWVANDDGAGGRNPMIYLPNPKSGRYDVFVGTFGPNPAPATLYIRDRTSK